VGVAAGASIAVVAEICGVFAKRMPTLATTAANTSENKVLTIIWLYELVVHLIGVWIIAETLKRRNSGSFLGNVQRRNGECFVHLAGAFGIVY
jgi:hypothetical protein